MARARAATSGKSKASGGAGVVRTGPAGTGVVEASASPRERPLQAANASASPRERLLQAANASASPRERLLQAANELFYAEGIHTVGIDRVIEKAGVAKASLYATFGSKDELVRAYLELRAQARQMRIEKRLATLEAPRDKLLAVFDVLHDVARDPQFRGCAFVNASAEGSREGDAHEGVHNISSSMRAWTRELFTSLAKQLGVRDPVRLGRAVHLLYDGAVIGASMDRHPAIALAARDAAAVLIDAAMR